MTDDIRVERMPRRIRTMVAGRFVADTIAPLLVWEVLRYPTYFFPKGDVDMDLLVDTGETKSARLGEATLFHLAMDDSIRKEAGYAYPGLDAVADHVAFRWDAMDHWFEEDDEVFVHARDPYTRVDILRSSRPVRIEIDGKVVAESTNASFLYETGHPVRYYLPKTDVRFELLSESDKQTRCPYKGTARYWNVTVGDTDHPDIVWCYDHPWPESQKVAGLVCFYNDKVDLYVDEVLQ